jgi:hypothetical protein
MFSGSEQNLVLVFSFNCATFSQLANVPFLTQKLGQQQQPAFFYFPAFPAFSSFSTATAMHVPKVGRLWLAQNGPIDVAL